MGRTNIQTNGFKAYLNGESYGYIGFYKWALILNKNNTRKTKCIRCQSGVEAGEAVYHKMSHDNGFICMECAKSMILKFGTETGFRENVIFNLQCCYLSPADFTAQEVVNSIRRIETAPLIHSMVAWDPHEISVAR